MCEIKLHTLWAFGSKVSACIPTHPLFCSDSANAVTIKLQWLEHTSSLILHGSFSSIGDEKNFFDYGEFSILLNHLVYLGLTSANVPSIDSRGMSFPKLLI